MIKWIVKKYAIGLINNLLEDYHDDVDKVKDLLNLWIARVDKILYTLRSMLSKLDDNQLSDDEVEKTIDELTTAIKQW
jgi:hypothetical protein